MNGEYLINRRYVCFRCNLNERIDRLESSYENLQPSVIYGTREKKIELSMTEKIHTQKVSLIGRIFKQSPYDAKEELKNRWKK